MFFVLYLALVFSLCLSNICFGMERENQEKKWEIHHVNYTHLNLDEYSCKDRLIFGMLQIYFRHEDNDDDYYDAARFKSADGAIINLSNFNTLSKTSKNIFFDNKFRRNLCIPIHIWDKQDQRKDLVVTKIEMLDETEKLLDIPKLELWTNGDNIEFKYSEDMGVMHKIYHSDNIHAIRQALSLGKQFVVKFVEGDDQSVFKVIEYQNGSYIWWDGWSPSTKDLCIGMSVRLRKSEPDEVMIDLGKEKEELHHYQRNQWISRILTGAIFIVVSEIAYRRIAGL